MATFLDLFAGCGGFSVGLQRAGLTSVGEVELDGWAADSLRANFPESRVLEGDIRGFDDEVIRSFVGVDVIVGGPPCQGFSVAGATQFGIDDPRNDLVHWFLHWVRILVPRIAIIENVPNILTKSKNGSTVLDAVKKELCPIGYSVEARVLNSGEFGTPQLRRRAFIVASAPGITFHFPKATHGSGVGSVKDLFSDPIPFVTVGDAISDLPLLEAGEGTDDPTPYASVQKNPYQQSMRQGSLGVMNHVAMRHTDRLIERFKVIKPGQSLKDVPLEHGQIAKLTGETVKKPFKYNNYRLDSTKPSLASPASFQSLFLHPTKHRNLTAREAARIMGFPDSFEFKGKRTTMSWEKNLSQYNQIGNAVCPPVATALGRAIIEALGTANVSELSAFAPLQIPSTSPKLARSTPLRCVKSVSGTKVSAELTEIGQRFLGRDDAYFSRLGFSIPTATLPAALMFAADRSCPVCSPSFAPFCSHKDEIPFLISKEDLNSLRENEQDHGLDYHLRAAFGIPHQVGHLVGEQLSELGLVDLVMLKNERTGRNVRGMRLREVWTPPVELIDRFHEALFSEDYVDQSVG